MFVLSGEHPTLPFAEVKAAIRAERRTYTPLEHLDQLLVLETKARPEELARRLGMCKEICLHLCTSSVEEVLESLASTDVVDLIPHGKTIAVRVKRIKRYSQGLDVLELAKRIADLLSSEVEFKVELKRPDLELLAVLTNGSCAIGTKAASVDRAQFTKRRPSQRAAFHPGTLIPVLARCMVNLARVPRGGRLLDPFCGMGGILIEAGLVGAKPMGMDIDERMVEGARKNLQEAGIEDFELRVGDARKLPPLEVDSIATDPPFGRQTTTLGLTLQELYREALPSLAQALRRNGYMCIASPAGLELEDLAKEAGLKFVERHEQRVHKSLTRLIYVFKRK